MVSLADSTLTLRIDVLPHSKSNFSNWQSKLRAQISQAQGFSSLEILSPFSSQSNTCFLNLRFISKENLDLWLQSPPYGKLLKELADWHIINNPYAISKENRFSSSSGVTEVYVTFVDDKNLLKFHEWHEKIHRIESTFPGFQKVYIQAPDQKKEGAWITLLQFDTLTNLEHWLNSSQRAEILKESEDFIKSKETHQLLSSFGGWFSDRSLARNPPRWKQTMVILAVLYPIVMIQYLYLAAHLSFLELSLKTFVENVISVTLLAWPMLPIAIYALRWWLDVKFNPTKDLLGVGILLLVYAIEIVAFGI